MEKSDISRFLELFDLFLRHFQSPAVEDLKTSIVSSITIFADADFSVLCLSTGNGTITFQCSSPGNICTSPFSLPLNREKRFIERSIASGRLIESTNSREIEEITRLSGHERFSYASALPLRDKHSLIGCLILFKKDKSLLPGIKKKILTLFGNQAAVALRTAQIYDELKAEKDFSDAIFQSVASGVMVLDAHGAVVRTNKAGSEILGMPPENFIGKKISSVYPEFEKMAVLTTDVSRETEITLKDGSTLPIGFSSSPFRDKRGAEQGTLIVFRDLTEIKELQAEVRKKQHFETIGKVISGVAHEIRNPLFAIQSIAQILEREIDSPHHQTLVKALLKESTRMRTLLEELLTYSRASKLAIADIDLETFLAELREYMKAKDKSIKLLTHISSPTVIRGDRDKLHQVFLNLLNNAIEAGGRQIDATVRKADAAVVVALKDNGCGIGREHLGQIFDPFFTTKKEGTGLGLSICRKIMEDHGGSLKVVSTKGKGTTVTLTLPA